MAQQGPIPSDAVGNLNGLFKEVYAPRLESLIPESAKLVKMIPYVGAGERNGNYWHQPVVVQNENGVTYAAPQSGAFLLNQIVPMATADAQVQGSQILIGSNIPYETVQRASAGGKQAFLAATDVIIENMMESHTLRLEISFLYGGSGLGTVASFSNVSSTSTTLTLTPSTYAPGIWQGMEQSFLDFYVGSSVQNTGTAALGTGPQISSVSVGGQSVTITGTAGDITAIQNAVTSNPNAVNIYWGGAFGNECVGLNTILTNTGSLFNINAATYNLWSGNSFPVGGTNLTQGKINSAVALACSRGLNEKAVLLVNPTTWANLMTSQSAQRLYDSSYSDNEYENGARAIKFYAQNGEVEVVAHNCVKAGDAFLFPPKRLKRLGACEVTFGIPGIDDRPFMQLQTNAGFQLRNYSNQAIFVTTPARCVKLTGIQNT